MAKISEKITNNSAPLMVLLLVVAAFFIGRLSAQVDALKSGGVAAQPAAQPVVQPAAQQPGTTNVTMDQIKALFGKDVVKFGDQNKKLVFVEVSDPSCPYCQAATGLNSALNKQMGAQFNLVADGGNYVAPVVEMKKLLDQNKIGYVWIYSNGHGNGELGAKALFCANEKGKFWDAHALLFSAQGYDLMNNVVKNDVAQSAKMADFLKNAVDQNFMKGCLSSDKYKGRLTQDIAIAQSLGVNGTPGFFVNTTSYPGAVSFNDMRNVVDAALK